MKMPYSPEKEEIIGLRRTRKTAEFESTPENDLSEGKEWLFLVPSRK